MEFMAPSKESLKEIDLSLLRRDDPGDYRLDSGDTLGIHIDGITAPDDAVPFVRFPEDPAIPPSVGSPFVVNENGAVKLPIAGDVNVRGMTLSEAEDAIIDAYTVRKEILPDTEESGRQAILVTLMMRRTIRVFVVREDAHSQSVPVNRGYRQNRGRLNRTVSTGEGIVLNLPPGENDVLTALTESGGLPGVNAEDEVLVFRARSGTPSRDSANLDNAALDDNAGLDDQAIRIPLRIPANSQVPFSREDVILNSGDSVVVRNREAEVFYTGGLLPSGEYELPRNYDIDAIEAVSLVGGPLLNGGISSNNLSGGIIAGGIGGPSPSHLAVVRTTPSGARIPILVDINRAINDPRENLLIQKGDFLVLQESPGEAIGRYSSQVFGLDIIWEAFRTNRSIGTATATLP